MSFLSKREARLTQRSKAVFLDSALYHWISEKREDFLCYSKGRKNSLDTLVQQVQGQNAPDISGALQEILNSASGYGSAVIEGQDISIAWVDHIRTWPLFYGMKNGGLVISPDARVARDALGFTDNDVDPDAALEFSLAGYVTGESTLYKGLSALRPGEFLVWRKGMDAPLLQRYFRYQPTMEESRENEQELIGNLNDVMDTIIKNMIARVGGRPIWLPLSGGLDSRIILCKLHEHGARNVHTFSYGPKFNFEALKAKQVAKTLGYPWQFVAPDKETLRGYFESDERKAFWRYADGLKAIPCMREYAAIRWLHESGQVPKDAVFINGQSGDYISGGHIHPAWLEKTPADADLFYKLLTDKHYDLWSGLKTPGNMNVAEKWIDRLLPAEWKSRCRTRADYAAMGEAWEYDGRQICYVVNGQRIYEFLGYDWEMPLWEKELVDFYQPISLKDKFDQNLWKKWLKAYNYKGLFPEKESYIWRWAVPMLWVVPAAQIVGMVAGRKAKSDFYALMRYFGHYGNQYVFFPWREHVKTYKSARNVIALHVRQWVGEHQKLFSERVLEALDIDKE
jgi:asparagine synthase (glutamine-hydrolysing)